MKIEHHPHEETLMSYAAGSLPAALAFVVGAHLEGCGDCRRRVAEAETVGGQLLQQLEPRELGGDARDNILRRLAEVEPDDAPPPVQRRPSRSGIFLPGVLRDLLGVSSYEEIPWRTMAPGVKQYNLPLNEGKSVMLSIAGGRKMPVHTHGGTELTLILQGGYNDELGSFRVGDVADLDGSIEHQPVADRGEDCIVLAGLDARVRFRGLLARLFQPLTGL